MNQAPQINIFFSAEEIFWGVVLVAFTMLMHGYGMLLVLRVATFLGIRVRRSRSPTLSVARLILVSWMIMFLHLFEVFIWALFFYFSGGIPDASNAYYFALGEYTTLGSAFNLPFHWRLLEGMTSIAGLLTFAWSTGVLLTLAQEFQDRQLEFLLKRNKKSHS